MGKWLIYNASRDTGPETEGAGKRESPCEAVLQLRGAEHRCKMATQGNWCSNFGTLWKTVESISEVAHA